jgi:hypothetical protein
MHAQIVTLVAAFTVKTVVKLLTATEGYNWV